MRVEKALAAALQIGNRSEVTSAVLFEYLVGATQDTVPRMENDRFEFRLTAYLFSKSEKNQVGV